MNTTTNSIKKQQPHLAEIPIATPLAISQCMSKTVQTHSEIQYSAIWVKNIEHVKYAYLYNQT